MRVNLRKKCWRLDNTWQKIKDTKEQQSHEDFLELSLTLSNKVGQLHKCKWNKSLTSSKKQEENQDTKYAHLRISKQSYPREISPHCHKLQHSDIYMQNTNLYDVYMHTQTNKHKSVLIKGSFCSKEEFFIFFELNQPNKEETVSDK